MNNLCVLCITDAWPWLRILDHTNILVKGNTEWCLPSHRYVDDTNKVPCAQPRLSLTAPPGDQVYENITDAKKKTDNHCEGEGKQEMRIEPMRLAVGELYCYVCICSWCLEMCVAV